METTNITISIIFIALGLIAAYIAYEMAHAYDLPEDEEETSEEDNSQRTQQLPTPTPGERTETKNSLEDAE